MASYALLGIGIIIDLYSVLLLLLSLIQRRPRSAVMVVPLVFYGMFIAVRANMSAALELPLVGALAGAHIALQCVFLVVARRLENAGRQSTRQTGRE